jgi:transcriptional regulator with XRE-family HTH domain
LEATVDDLVLRQERGARLKEARRRANLTVRELVQRVASNSGGRLRFSVSAVSGWETGRNLCPLRFIREIANALNCTPADLLGTPSPDELDEVYLGGRTDSDGSPSAAATLEAARSVEVTLTVRTPGDRGAVRQRSWSISYDRLSKQLTIRSGAKTSPHGLLLARPAGAEPHRFPESIDALGVLPDIELDAVHVPFDGQQALASAETRILSCFAAEVLTRDDLRQLFAEPDEFRSQSLQGLQKPAASMKVKNKIRKATKDVEQEVADFVGDRMAQRLVACWEEGSEYLQRFVEDVVPKETHDPFQRRLVEAVASLSLQKDFAAATAPLQELQRMVGTDPIKKCDILYLRGRQCWYLKRDEQGRSLLSHGIQQLAEAYRIAHSASRLIRAAQSLLYLSRIAADAPNLAQEVQEAIGIGPLDLASEAEKLGRQLHRFDIELLARRAQVMQLYNGQRYEEAEASARELLARFEAEDIEGDFRHILDHLRINRALALRRLGGDGRQQAEEIYKAILSADRDDSTPGVVTYLLGDLYSDQAGDARLESQIAAQSGHARRARKLSRKSHDLYRQALDHYQRSEEMLRERGDQAALRKASYRCLWTEDQLLPAPRGRQEAADQAGAREQATAQHLIGKSFDTQPRAISLEQFEAIINLRSLPMTAGDDLERRHVADYLGEYATLVLLPWLCGSSLSLQVLAWNPRESNELAIIRWIAIRNWTSRIRPLIRSTLADQQVGQTKEQVRRLRKDLWVEIADNIRALVGDAVPTFDRALVVTPSDLIDLRMPLESLLEARKTGERLIETTRSLVYAGPWTGSQGTFLVHVPPEKFEVYAGDEAPGITDAKRGRPPIPLRAAVSDRTSHQAKSLPGQGAKLYDAGVVVVCHEDVEGKLRKLIASWDFRSRCVVLAFCGSGPLDVVSGPFADGLAVRIRRQLGPDGVVVCTRLPISVEEATRMIRHLKSHGSDQRLPVATLVTQYVQQQLRLNRDPYAFPWVVL